MSNSEIIEWLKKKAESVTMPGSRKMYQAAVNALEAQKYPDWTAKEKKKVVGSLAHYDLIIQAVVFLLLIIELTGSILAIKKLSDKRLNVI